MDVSRIHVPKRDSKSAAGLAAIASARLSHSQTPSFGVSAKSNNSAIRFSDVTAPGVSVLSISL